MQPQMTHVPPSASRSTTAVLRPSWAQRIAPTYPAGPPPMKIASNDGMVNQVERRKKDWHLISGFGRLSSAVTRRVDYRTGIQKTTDDRRLNGDASEHQKTSMSGFSTSRRNVC